MDGKRTIWFVVVFGLALTLTAQVWQFLQVRSVRRDIKGVGWLTYGAFLTLFEDEITLDVGTIQFMKHHGGFSIQLEEVAYRVDGLALKGYVGNPTNLRVSNVTLNVSASRPLEQYREQFLRSSPEPFHIDPIGRAQSSPIPSLAPGTREHFEVTIPNVRQTKEGVRLTVWFSGENYSYSGY